MARPNAAQRMPLRQHLLELRKRIFLSAIGILVGAVLGWIVYGSVFTALTDPLIHTAQDRGVLAAPNFGGVASAVDMQVKVSVFLGALLSSPWWLYQLFAFITPGLTGKEKRYAFGFLGAAVPLFTAGAAVAWFLLPRAVSILNEFVPEGSANLVDAQNYLSFVMRFILAFGVAFLVPVVMVTLTMLGVVRAATWLKGWRWAILISFVFAAVMTPTPDVLSMVAIALPICALYFVAYAICALHDRRSESHRVAPGI